MSVSSLNITVTTTNVSTASSMGHGPGGLANKLQSLMQAIKAGDTNGAKTALADIEKNRPPGVSAENSPFAGVAQALAAGDLQGASAALTTMMNGLANGLDTGASSTTIDIKTTSESDLADILDKLAKLLEALDQNKDKESNKDQLSLLIASLFSKDGASSSNTYSSEGTAVSSVSIGLSLTA